jgi:hypothetical protein
MIVFGPGLPNLQSSDCPGPCNQFYNAEVRANEGALLFESPEDQSTCDHVQSEEMNAVTEVQDGRCHFYEEYGGSHSWVLIDQNFMAADAGKYRFVIFSGPNTGPLTSTKLWFACCDWPEDFITPFQIPETTCPYCGTSDTFGQWASHFYEQKSMTEYGGFPAYEECTGQPDLPYTSPQFLDLPWTAMPDPETQCPDESTPEIPEAGASCDLGCSGGVCHSHSVFGECNYPVYWINPQPMLNGNVITKLEIYTGETVTFSSNGHQMPHNLYAMAGEDKMESCMFDDASQIGNVEDINAGKSIMYDVPGTYSYACEIGCSMDSESPSCHCNMGQQLIVEVTDSAEGTSCHSHMQAAQPLACGEGETSAYFIGPNSDYDAEPGECAEFCMMTMVVGIIGATAGSCADAGYTLVANQGVSVQPAMSPSPIMVTIMAMPMRRLAYGHVMQRQTLRARRLLTTCGAGDTNAYIIGSADYGAAPNQCSEFCVGSFMLQYMAGVAEGSCLYNGFPVPDTTTSVQPAGSPMPMQVDIYSLDEGGGACHCHSYEEILCGPEGDPLYDEHIDEILAHCQGVVDGTDDTCPYLCFQPFEVLHLHYIECSYREHHSMFLAIQETEQCHIGASVPFGAPCAAVPDDSMNEPGDGDELNTSYVELPQEGFCHTIPRDLAMELSAVPCSSM